MSGAATCTYDLCGPPPPDPSSHDPIVHTAAELADHLSRAANKSQPISLRISGVIPLGSLPPTGAAPTLLPWIEAGGNRDSTRPPSVTLWGERDDGLDAQKMGRIFVVIRGGQLRLEGLQVIGGFTPSNTGGCGYVQDAVLRVRGVRFFNCTVSEESGGGIMVTGRSQVTIEHSTFERCDVDRRNGLARGGAIAVEGGDVEIVRTNISDSQASSVNAFAFGGGIAIWGSGNVSVVGSTLHRTRAISINIWAWGGGIGLDAGNVRVSGSTFEGTQTITGVSQTWGGGLGLNGGTAHVDTSVWEGSRSFSMNGEAWGGGLGMNDGHAAVHSSTMLRCEATGGRIGDGGGVGIFRSGIAALYNVSLRQSRSSSLDRGSALVARPGQLNAAVLTVERDCAPSSAHVDQPLIEGVGAVAALLLRNLTIDAPGCTRVLAPGTQLLQCADVEQPCGPLTVCTTNTAGRVPTPTCECEPDDLSMPFVQPLPAPQATSPLLAPYTSDGCVLPTSPREWQLHPNWWRLSEHTRDLHVCREGWENERVGSSGGGRRLPDGLPWTNCQGGRSVSGYCAPGLTGVLCTRCTAPNHYFDANAADCMPCELRGAPQLLWRLEAALLALFAAWWLLRLVCLGYRQRRGRESTDERDLLGSLQARLQARLGGLTPRSTASEAVRKQAAWARLWLVRTVAHLDLVAKLKILIGYYQVVLVMPRAFRVTLPAFYAEVMMRYFQWASFEWVSALIFPLNLGCLGSYADSILVQSLGPLALLAVFSLGSVLVAWIELPPPEADAGGRDGGSSATDGESIGGGSRCTRRGWALASLDGMKRALPLVLMLLFALVPSVCSSIFSVFPCDTFGYRDEITANDGIDGAAVTRRFLAADLSVECDSEEHNQLRSLAVWLIVLWPVGVPLFFATLLWKARQARQPAPRLWRATTFLHGEFRVGMSWWELLELMRKLVLTGFVVILPRGMQLLTALLVCFGHLVVLQGARPYKERSTMWVALGTSCTLLCTFQAALLVRLYDDFGALRMSVAASRADAIAPRAASDVLREGAIYPITAAILIFNFAVVAIGASLLAFESRGLLVLRLRASGQLPVLTLAPAKRWHLFLSQYALAALPAAPTHATCCAHMYGRAVFVCPAPGTTRTRS